MKPASEERIIAALAHLSALALGIGMVVPAILWTSQREKSKYAAFQSLQAYGYQTLGYTIWLLAYLAFVILLVIALIPMSMLAGQNSNAQNVVMFGWMGIFFLSIFGMIGLYLLVPLIGAVMCGLGKDFRYPLMGSRLAKYIGYNPNNSDDHASLSDVNMDRFAAAMGHFSVIFFLWGLVAPLALWIMEGKRSVLLRFQSAQTVAYQMIGNIAYFILSGLYYVAVIAMIPFIDSASEHLELVAGSAIVLMCVLALALLLGPLYHIFGQWAGLQVLRGRDFRYPLLGPLIANWFAKREQNTVEEKLA